jgi:cyclopropane-fatty-acyl-phospholipid synthase
VSIASDYSRCIRLLNELFRGYNGPAFAIHFPLGTWHSAGSRQPAFSLGFRSLEAIGGLVQPSESALGEAFISGDLDVEGDIFATFDAIEWLLGRHAGIGNRILAGFYSRCFAALNLLARGRKHSQRRDAASISHHYDLPVEFFEPWLGPTLLYSAGYFRDAANGLDTAQTDKLDLICRKLDLHAGDHFMDIGCGWGGLAIYAASRYGAQTRGITISKSQAGVAARRIAETHLDDLCFVEYRDYRDAPSLPWRFDKLASIGMFEHVGIKKLPGYFRIAFDLLQSGGAFLISGIVRAADSPHRKQSFIDQYVFPDGELPTLTEELRAAEEAGFEVRDVESLREHYAQTLRLWVRNLQQHATELRHIVPERTLRIWLLYMAGSAAAFERGEISVCQILLRKPGHTAKLHTREDWYAKREAAGIHLAA